MKTSHLLSINLSQPKSFESEYGALQFASLMLNQLVVEIPDSIFNAKFNTDNENLTSSEKLAITNKIQMFELANWYNTVTTGEPFRFNIIETPIVSFLEQICQANAFIIDGILTSDFHVQSYDDEEDPYDVIALDAEAFSSQGKISISLSIIDVHEAIFCSQSKSWKSGDVHITPVTTSSF